MTAERACNTEQSQAIIAALRLLWGALLSWAELQLSNLGGFG